MKPERARAGDWYSIRTKHGMLALAVVVRRNERRGVLNGVNVCAFFRLPPADVSLAEYMETVGIADAVCIAFVANVDPIYAGWRYGGRISRFEKREWPMPLVVDRSQRWLYRYDETEPARLVERVPLPLDASTGYVPDEVLGSGVVERQLVKLLTVGR